MKLNAYIAGVGMTRFGKYLDRGLKSIGIEAVEAALKDAGIEKTDLQAAWVGNAAAGVVTGQECIRGEVVLRGMGIGKIPVVNVENACASSSTAFNQACAMVSAGYYDCVLALGVEKLYHEDKRKTFGAFSGAVDVRGLRGDHGQLEKKCGSQWSGRGKQGGGRKALHVYGYICHGGARTHESLRHHGGTIRRCIGQEFPARVAQPPRAISRSAVRRRGAGITHDSRATDPAHVFTHW